MPKAVIPLAALALLILIGWGAMSFLDSEPRRADLAPLESDPAEGRGELPHEQLPEGTAEAERREAPRRGLDEASAGATRPDASRFGCVVRGRLVERDGTPVPGRPLELLAVGPVLRAPTWEARLDRSSLRDYRVAEEASDADGVFELRVPDPVGVHLLNVDPAGERATTRWLPEPLAPGRRVELGDIVLAPVARWWGWIVDPEGEPVADARVRLSPLPAWLLGGSPPHVGDEDLIWVAEGREGRPSVLPVPGDWSALESMLPLPSTRTDDNGRFELAGPDDRPLHLWVDREGFAGTVHGPFVASERDLGRLELSRGRRLVGEVVDSEGDPVEGAVVCAGGELGGWGLGVLHRGSTTDADGLFEVPGVETAGPDWFAVRRRPQAAWQLIGPLTPKERQRLVLPARPDLRVRLTDVGGQPLEGATLVLRPRDGAEQPWLRLLEDWTDTSPRFEDRGKGHYQATDLVPGPYELLGRHESRIGVKSLRIDEDREVVLRLGPGVSLSLEVVDEDDGGPIPGVTVSARIPGLHASLRAETRTDGSGLATLGPFPANQPADLELQLRHPGYAPLSWGLGAQDWPLEGRALSLSLSSGGAIEGRVLRDGSPITTPVWISLRREGSDEVLPELVSTGGDGGFRFERLQPGLYRWRVYQDLGGEGVFTSLARGPFSADLFATPATLREGRIEVRPGRARELRIELQQEAEASAAVEVKVACSHPRPVPMMLQLDGPSKVELPVRSDEWSERGGLLPGEYLARVILPAQETGSTGIVLHESRFELGSGESHRLEARVELFDLRLVVVDPGGRRVAGAWCHLKQGEEQLERHADASGELRVAVPRQGAWIVRAYHSDFGAGHDRLSAPSTGMGRLVLDPGLPCEGVVVLREDLQLGANLQLALRPVDGGDGRSTRVDAQSGAFRVVGLGAGSFEAVLVDRDTGRRFTTSMELPEQGSRRLRLEF